jgi:hypothetical protein
MYQHFFVIRMKEINSNLMQSSAKIDDLHISQWFAVCLVSTVRYNKARSGLHRDLIFFF